MFRQICQSCILNVRELFVELFFRKVFSIYYGIWAKIFPALSKFFNKIVKNELYVSRGTLWQKQYDDFAKQIPTCFRQRNVGFFGGKFAAFLSNLHFCLQMGNWKNSFERIFSFSDFFGTSREHFFWFFWCILRGLVVQIEFHRPRWTYPLGKSLWENFLSFPDYERIFLNIHWSLLGMLSKLQFTCSEEHIEKSYHFLRFFQNCFRTLSDNRPHLFWKISTALPKLHSACPRNFSIFFAVVCHVLFNFGFEREKS